MDHLMSLLRSYVRGWMGYFGLAAQLKLFDRLDQWLRRRIRACYWKQWRCPRRRREMLIRLGVPRRQAIRHARSRKGPWHMARYLIAMGYCQWSRFDQRVARRTKVTEPEDPRSSDRRCVALNVATRCMSCKSLTTRFPSLGGNTIWRTWTAVDDFTTEENMICARHPRSVQNVLAVRPLPLRAATEKSLETDEPTLQPFVRWHRPPIASKPSYRKRILATLEYLAARCRSRINQRKQKPSQLG
jgi:Group II intron, maturase-specific domain